MWHYTTHMILAMRTVGMLEVWAHVSDARYSHNELGNTLLSAHIITGEYVAHYFTSLIQKVILIRNVLLCANLVASFVT